MKLKRILVPLPSGNGKVLYKQGVRITYWNSSTYVPVLPFAQGGHAIPALKMAKQQHHHMLVS